MPVGKGHARMCLCVCRPFGHVGKARQQHRASIANSNSKARQHHRVSIANSNSKARQHHQASIADSNAKARQHHRASIANSNLKARQHHRASIANSNLKARQHHRASNSNSSFNATAKQRVERCCPHVYLACCLDCDSNIYPFIHASMDPYPLFKLDMYTLCVTAGVRSRKEYSSRPGLLLCQGLPS